MTNRAFVRVLILVAGTIVLGSIASAEDASAPITSAPVFNNNQPVLNSGPTVTLFWTAPNIGVAISYVIEASSVPGGPANLANFNTGNALTSVVVPNVPAGTYYVRIRALDAGGLSAPSNEVQLVVGQRRRIVSVCTAWFEHHLAKRRHIYDRVAAAVDRRAHVVRRPGRQFPKRIEPRERRYEQHGAHLVGGECPCGIVFRSRVCPEQQLRATGVPESRVQRDPPVYRSRVGLGGADRVPHTDQRPERLPA